MSLIMQYFEQKQIIKNISRWMKSDISCIHKGSFLHSMVRNRIQLIHNLVNINMPDYSEENLCYWYEPLWCTPVSKLLWKYHSRKCLWLLQLVSNQKWILNQSCHLKPLSDLVCFWIIELDLNCMDAGKFKAPKNILLLVQCSYFMQQSWKR